MTEAVNDDVIMDNNAVSLIHSLIRNALTNKALALQLKKNWEDSDFIAENEFFENVYSNKPLMRTMIKHLANGLSESMEQSLYGLGILTDHELYFQGKTDAMLTQLLTSKNILLSHEKFVALSKKRTLLYKFVKDTKDQAVINMEFIGKIYFMFHFFLIGFINPFL